MASEKLSPSVSSGSLMHESRKGLEDFEDQKHPHEWQLLTPRASTPALAGMRAYTFAFENPAALVALICR